MAGSLTQDGRPIVLTTPLGKDKLLALEVTAREALSQLFTVEVESFAPASAPADFGALLGQPCGVALAPGAADSPGAPGVVRHFHGICSRVEEGERNADFVRYTLTLVPKPWLLTRKTRSRIFQQKTVPDILKEVLQGYDVDWKTQGTFEKRDFCVQYRESDFDFASRLMEEEGIWYCFVHSAGAHKMLVANMPASHADIPGSPTVNFEEDLGAVREPDRVHEWSKSQELRSGKVLLWDHCFELTDKHLEADKVVQESAAVGKATHKLKVGGNDALELYDFPGGYAQRFDGVDPSGGDRAADVQKIFQDNKRTAEIRMQAETVCAVRIAGSGNAVRMCAGHKFQLARHPGDADGKYVLTSVVHRASGGGNYASGSEDPFTYSNSFECIPEAVPFRPARVTPVPYVRGSQTALVVGPAGEEIFTDKYARVKVQFHWDREGKKDSQSACWLRVATTWAGKQWGAIHIPRIGQEVIVDFLEGDPDQPIIVGSVYNAEQMPPYALPDNKTQSGVKSRSSSKGTAENFNEIRFEDKKDSEEIYVHAEKNFKRVVENEDVLEVGLSKKDKGTQTITIHGDRTETIKEGNETVTIEKGSRVVTILEGDETLTVEKGSRAVTVTEGDDTFTVAKGGHTEKVKMDYVLTVEEGAHKVTLDKGNYEMKVSGGDHSVTLDKGGSKVTISMGDQTTKLAAGKSSLEAMASIEFKCGPSSIKIAPDGITIKGPMVTVQADATLEAKSPMTTVKGDGMLTLKGGLTMIN